MKAMWNDKIIADSEETIVVERNHYFPMESVKREYLKESDTQTVCPWKGLASYYHLDIDGEINEDAVWYYPEPKSAALEILNRVAFWKGVKVTK